MYGLGVHRGSSLPVDATLGWWARTAFGAWWQLPPTVGHLARQSRLVPGHQPAPPWQPARGHSPHPAASLADITRIYGIRHWIEQSYKQVKDELGWADFEVHSDVAIRRYQVLVNYRSASTGTPGSMTPRPPRQPATPRPGPSRGERWAARRRPSASASVAAAAAHDTRLAFPWIALQRWWPAWSTAPPQSAGAHQLGRGRLWSAPLHPELTN